MEFIPMYVDEPQNKEPGDIIKNTDWNNLFNLLMTQGNHNTDALLEITQTYPTTAQMNSAIAERIVEIGAGDMAKAVYDTDEDGIVDLAETVVDGGITTDKIANEAVTENKLNSFLLSYIQTAYITAMDKSRVKFGKISELTPSSTQQGATNQYTTINQYKTYNIGFTPTILIVFSVKKAMEGSSNTYDIGPSFGQWYHGNSHSDISVWGGIAYPEHTIATWFPEVTQNYGGSEEAFRLVTNGFRLHEYYYSNSDKTLRNYRINFDDSYYLAIG